MTEEATILQFCECDSDCTLSMKLPLGESEENGKIPGHVIIISGCKTGPSPGDQFVEKRKGYTFYTMKI